MKRKIGLCLAFRDMWQSSCGRFPTPLQLRELAPAIVAMGCFGRVETNGGAFEQMALLQGENPNVSVREFVACFREAGVKTQMLERGLNALSLNPVSSDVRELMFKVKKSQGVDVVRSFCGLNDHRNLLLSVKSAKYCGMVSQVALPIVNSPVHTLEYYLDVVDKVVDCGADEICIKNMSGRGDSAFMAELTRRIRQSYPSLFIQYHGHCGPDTRESLLEVVRAGADAVDVAIAPLSGGAGHPDVLEVADWLRSDGFLVDDIDADAYKCVVSLLRSCLAEMPSAPDRLEDFCEMLMNVGLPGGMMASLSNDLNRYNSAVNDSLKLQGAPELTREQFVAKFADEVEFIWPLLGYPPMVTPFSQYVANAVLSNLLSMSRGLPRWSLLTTDVWNMILGRMGRLPGAVCSELSDLALMKGFEFYAGCPADLYPETLDRFRSMMDSEGWDAGADDEELLEFALHEGQYRSYMNSFMNSDSASDSAVFAAIAMALHEYLA